MLIRADRKRKEKKLDLRIKGKNWIGRKRLLTFQLCPTKHHVGGRVTYFCTIEINPIPTSQAGPIHKTHQIRQRLLNYTFKNFQFKPGLQCWIRPSDLALTRATLKSYCTPCYTRKVQEIEKESIQRRGGTP